jgi:hypothetical protein
MAAPIRRREHHRMLGRISRRTPLLLALATTLLLAWTGKTPAFAACTPGAADKPDLAFVDSNCDCIDDAIDACPIAAGGQRLSGAAPASAAPSPAAPTPPPPVSIRRRHR